MDPNEDRTVALDEPNSSSGFPSEVGNARQNKKKRRSILKMPANPMPDRDREALKEISNSGTDIGLSSVTGSEILSGQNCKLTGASITAGGKCGGVRDKRRRSSISRRVSFSTTTRVKEFHDGRHELPGWNSTYEDEPSALAASSSSSSAGQSTVPSCSTTQQSATATISAGHSLLTQSENHLETYSENVYVNRSAHDQTLALSSDVMEETDCIDIFANAGHTGRVPPFDLRQSKTVASGNDMDITHAVISQSQKLDSNIEGSNRTLHSSSTMDITLATNNVLATSFAATSTRDDAFSNLFATAGIKKTSMLDYVDGMDGRTSSERSRTLVSEDEIHNDNYNHTRLDMYQTEEGERFNNESINTLNQSNSPMELTCKLPSTSIIATSSKDPFRTDEDSGRDGMEITCKTPVLNVATEIVKEFSSKEVRSTVDEIEKRNMDPNTILDGSKTLLNSSSSIEITCNQPSAPPIGSPLKIHFATSTDHSSRSNDKNCMEMTCLPNSNTPANILKQLSETDHEMEERNDHLKSVGDVDKTLLTTSSPMEMTCKLPMISSIANSPKYCFTSSNIKENETDTAICMEMTCRIPYSNASTDITKECSKSAEVNLEMNNFEKTNIEINTADPNDDRGKDVTNGMEITVNTPVLHITSEVVKEFSSKEVNSRMNKIEKRNMESNTILDGSKILLNSSSSIEITCNQPSAPPIGSPLKTHFATSTDDSSRSNDKSCMEMTCLPNSSTRANILKQFSETDHEIDQRNEHLKSVGDVNKTPLNATTSMEMTCKVPITSSSGNSSNACFPSSNINDNETDTAICMEMTCRIPGSNSSTDLTKECSKSVEVSSKMNNVPNLGINSVNVDEAKLPISKNNPAEPTIKPPLSSTNNLPLMSSDMSRHVINFPLKEGNDETASAPSPAVTPFLNKFNLEQATLQDCKDTSVLSNSPQERGIESFLEEYKNTQVDHVHSPPQKNTKQSEDKCEVETQTISLIPGGIRAIETNEEWSPSIITLPSTPYSVNPAHSENMDKYEAPNHNNILESRNRLSCVPEVNEIPANNVAAPPIPQNCSQVDDSSSKAISNQMQKKCMKGKETDLHEYGANVIVEFLPSSDSNINENIANIVPVSSLDGHNAENRTEDIETINNVNTINVNRTKRKSDEFIASENIFFDGSGIQNINDDMTASAIIPSPPPHKLPKVDLQNMHKTEVKWNTKNPPTLPVIEDVLVEENISIFEHLWKRQNIADANHGRYMLDNWERRHGIWKLYKHGIPDATNVPPTASSSSSSSHVIIKFMHDTLELNLTLGHQITPDTLPNAEVKEEIIHTQEKDTKTVKRRTKTTVKVLHWTLLKIEFTNPSKVMLKNRKMHKNIAENGTENGGDVRLAHYLLLRNLTPSRLADMCPNTKSLEKTLAIISQIVTQAVRFTIDLDEIAGSHCFFKIISGNNQHKVLVGFHSLKQKFAFQLCIDFQQGLRAAANGGVIFNHGPGLNRNLVTEETVKQLVDHTNHRDGWPFLKALVRNVDTYILELEKLVVD